MVSAWAIVRVELLRFLRDRSNIFFVFVFPLLLVALIGAQFGGSVQLRIGVVADGAGDETERFLAGLDATDGIETVLVDDLETLEGDVARGLVAAGVVLPEGFDARVEAAEPVEVVFLGRPDASSTSLRTVIGGVLAEQTAPGRAAQLAASATGGEASELRDVAQQAQEQVPGLEVVSTTLGTDELAEEFAGLSQFDLGASSQLFLFTFLTSLAGSAALIQTRQLGVARRMLSTPTSLAAVVAGQAGGRFLVALTQAAYIVVATVLLFQVNWGDPLASGVVILLFALVAAAAGLLVGALFRNDSQASGAGVGLGIGLAALGGSMVPLELFPPVMRTVSRLTPHSWANEAMAEIVRRDGGLTDVLPQVGVLAGTAIVLFALGGWQLRRTIVR